MPRYNHMLRRIFCWSLYCNKNATFLLIMQWLLGLHRVMTCFNKTLDRIILTIKAKPNSSITTVTSHDEDYVYVSIAAVPDKDKANRELINYLCHCFAVKKEKIKILKGEKSHTKIVEVVTDISAADTFLLLAKLEDSHK